MGTLTAGQPRLSHYCEHKLPTSCRLSSIGECCACYDERPHAASYRTYIDGVGFVPRGTRWQRYCWFCKEYWENRVTASGLRPGQTRIPEQPDQTEFLKRWYEFHQGYRTVRRDDGSEERIAVLGEDFRDVAPGVLPRTLEELRIGRERSELEEREREQNRQRQDQNREPTEVAGPSLDETLEQMLAAATSEETQQSERIVQPPGASIAPAEGLPVRPNPNLHAQSMVPTGSRNREYQARRIAALRRELHRMRSGIERVITGLRELGENVPDHSEASQRLSALGSTLDAISPPSQEDAQRAINSVNALTASGDNSRGDHTLASIQARVDEARRQLEEATRNRDQAQSELDVAEQEVRLSQQRIRQLQSQQRTAENYMRLFGTREEMLAQGENYESPIGGLFSRAWERFRVAEEVRREERTLRQVLEDEERVASEDVVERLAELTTRERDVWGVPQAQNPSDPTTPRISDVERSDGNARSSMRLNYVRDVTAALAEQRGILDEQRRELESLHRDRPALADIPIEDVRSNDVNDVQRERALESRQRRRTALIVAGPPGQQLDDDPSVNNDRGQDAVFVLWALSESESIREFLTPSSRIGIDRLLRNARENSLDWADREHIENIMNTEVVIWGVRLPAERNRRRRRRREHISFSPDAHQMALAGEVIVHDVEVMAECFQMSSEMRDRSGLTPPAKLAMLFRLQRGERNREDREVLFRMLADDATASRARELHETMGEANTDDTTRMQALESDRRQAARQGDHSRSELDSQRRAQRVATENSARAALAASRAAMTEGPAALLRRMAERDEETRAAYQRMQENGYTPESMSNRRLREAIYRPMNLNDFTAGPSASDESGEEDHEGRGLDARNSGRPEEPMSEEDMTVLLDCRICYSQKAEICTLPCGHLTMCRWCSDQHSPTMEHDRTRPRRAANCPVCRKAIRQKVKVIRS